MLSRAMTYYIPKGHRSKRKKVFVVGSKKKGSRFYYGDRNFYRNEYLKSDHWKELRLNKLAQNPVCEICGSNGHVDVHHLEYRNLHDIELSDLQSLCRKCHHEQHQPKQIKRSKKSRRKPAKHKRAHPPANMRGIPKSLRSLIRKYAVMTK